MSSLLKGLFGFDLVGTSPVNPILNEGSAPPPPEVMGTIINFDQMPMEQVEGQAPVADNIDATGDELVGDEEPVLTIAVSGDDATGQTVDSSIATGEAGQR